MGALSSLNLSNCNIASTVKMAMPNPGMKEGDLIDGNPITFVYSSGNVDVQSYDGIRALVNAILDMRALKSLNISDNNLTNRGRDMLGKPCEHVIGLLLYLITTFVRPLLFCRCYRPH
jgi:hypothetical protein